ncbi:MAG: PAS domain-containing protein, partial [Anaerotignum sp.]
MAEPSSAMVSGKIEGVYAVKNHEDFIRESIIRDMSEGVMIIGMDGVIGYVNPAAATILDRSIDELQGRKFLRCFF